MPNDDAMERARKIVRKFPQIEPYVIGPLLQGCIAQALTESRDAALEEAAGIADKTSYRYQAFVPYEAVVASTKTAAGIASEIRRAKSTEQA